MPRTISDEEYNHLIGRKTVADFVEPIYNSRELGPDARALIKRAYPNLQIEGYDLKQELKADIERERNERLDNDRRRADAEETEKFKKLRQKVKDDYRFTDEGMEKLEKLMVDRNIGDYEAGAVYMASKEPKPSDSTPAQRYWNHEKQDGFAEISKDPEKWGYEQILGAAHRDAARMRNQGF